MFGRLVIDVAVRRRPLGGPVVGRVPVGFGKTGPNQEILLTEGVGITSGIGTGIGGEGTGGISYLGAIRTPSSLTCLHPCSGRRIKGP